MKRRFDDDQDLVVVMITFVLVAIVALAFIISK